jgi:hypothetical protein
VVLELASIAGIDGSQDNRAKPGLVFPFQGSQ